ncbi:DUF4129 domain-containing protein [Salinibacterium sp. ZJ77]|uniref:DUF4129 domain-containing protein n=1 Tax=Salinibacterium sp. ZJ77 TaxID=2708337 RepID=UPI0014212FB3|nr:DUF4129 domain-containing protein [Salinibacterium sp. ZJ77]
MVRPTGLLPLDVPVEPDADEASGWLADELEKTKYQPAETEEASNWLRDLIERITAFIDSLGGEGTAPGWSAALIVLAIAIIVVLILVFGLPRLRRRSAVATGEVFEADDERGSAAMRRAADAAAAAEDWPLAIAERFRALIRGLHERTLLSSVPGSTSHDVARRAGRALPAFASALSDAADDFDAVRYLGDPGDRDRYARLTALDEDVRRARPDLDADEHADALAGFEAPR